MWLSVSPRIEVSGLTPAYCLVIADRRASFRCFFRSSLRLNAPSPEENSLFFDLIALFSAVRTRNAARSKQRLFCGLFDYEPTDDSQLAIKEGEYYFLSSADDSGWYLFESVRDLAVCRLCSLHGRTS